MADNFSQLAKDFIDRANGGTGPTGTWRLEVLQKRLSANADGTPKAREIPVRIRRFLKGIPWAQVHDAIRYLISQSPYKGIIYNGVELKGEYRPTLTQWRRDDQEQVGGNAQGSYTLIQDLIEVTDDGDSLDTVSADSCSETEETTWVWDAPEIEELPYDGSQGVTYAIRQVRRNEDGTFDYAIVRQVAKTKFSGWIVTECDEYSRVSVKVFDNVYGGLFDGDPFTDGTTVLPIPAPCKTDNGTLVQVSVAQNPDCTFRVTVQKTEAKPNVEKTSETRKGLRGVVTSETTVATYPLPETGLELGEQVRNELRPDGLYDVTHVTVATEDVGDVGSSCDRTVFEHRHVETRNEASRPEGEADFAGGGKTYQVQSRATEEGTWDVTRTETTEIEQVGAQKTKQKTLRGVTETTVDRNVDNSAVTVTNIGDRVSVEMTPGGKWNRTVTKVSKEPVGDVGSSCDRTVFEHRHVESENVPDRPEPEASSAGGGKTYQVQSRATEEGTWDVSRTTVEEARDVTAQHVMRKTLRGVTETTVTRGTSDSSVSVSEVGDEVRVEQTPGGLWNRTETHASHEPVGEIGKSCTATPVVHTDTKVSNVPDGSQPEPMHQVAEVNVEKTVETRRTEEGTWDVTERTSTHVGFGPKTVSTTSGGQKTTTVEVFQNIEEAPNRTEGVNREVDVSVSRNSVGSYDGRVVTNEYVGREYDLADIQSETKTTHISGFVNKEEPPPTQLVGKNIEASVSARLNGHGTFDGTIHKETYREKEYDLADITSLNKTTHISGFVNQEEAPVEYGGINEEISVSAHLNGHGTFDGTVRRETFSPDSYNLATITSDTKDVDISGFVNQEEPPAPSYSGQNKEVSVSAHLNGHGTFDGTVHVETYHPVDDTIIAETHNAGQDEEIYSYHNKTSPSVKSAGDKQYVTASASMNGHGSYDGTYRIVTAKSQDTEWIEWESTQVMPTYTYVWSHGIRVFTNQTVAWVMGLKSGLESKDGSVSMSINSFGLVDGTASYRQLKEWRISDDAGEGGYREGYKTIHRWVEYPKDSGTYVKESLKVHVRTYIGRGNSGSEAQAISNSHDVAGLSLGPRTYLIEEPPSTWTRG